MSSSSNRLRPRGQGEVQSSGSTGTAGRDIARWRAADVVGVAQSGCSRPRGWCVIEAMSCGTPAVKSSAIGGLPETLTAFPDHLVPPGDCGCFGRSPRPLWCGWRRHSPYIGR